jgi:hypothetical protein
MKKEFIPAQQALDLEKLGFDGHCLSYFEINNTGNQNDLRYFFLVLLVRNQKFITFGAISLFKIIC